VLRYGIMIERSQTMNNVKKREIQYSVQLMQHSSADSLKSEIRRLMNSQPEEVPFLVNISIERECLKLKFSQIEDTGNDHKIFH